MIDRRPDGTETENIVPLRALVLSLVSLVVAGLAAIVWPESLDELAALVWLLALVPAFLFAYHRGWEGAATGLLIAMILMIAIEIVPALIVGTEVDWRIAGGVAVTFIAATLGLGALAEKLRRQKTSALQLAFRDSLTGLPNRRMLDIFLAHHFAASQRGQALTVAMFDLDRFKHYNDTYGHAAGDEALTAFGAILERQTRDSDVAGRYGGEEFLAILPGTDMAGAGLYADRVRESLARLDLAAGARVTVSGGIAVCGPTMNNPSELVRAADAALYQAKAAGGNRVEPGPGHSETGAITDAG
ncbi:MAG: GGDEF domain-containing protein [Gemmatimonadetes bacterium]|nr:GGDEF domain-containing protein [Gemmatimonadota bacterium]NNK47585.1 GGDEF domain-containing protein [Gemmatimonadota bacterium]